MKESVSRETLDTFGVSLKSDTLERLEVFATMLVRWNRIVNLVSASDELLLWERHILDSLQLVPYLPQAVERAVDLGSGAGFPGLVLAIATGIPFDLIEADHRKASFLQEAARETAAPARIHATRVETAGVERRPLVTARAFAPLVRLLPIAVRLLAPGGVCLFPKGRAAADELTEAAQKWHMNVISWPSRTSADSTLLEISEIRPVGSSAPGI